MTLTYMYICINIYIYINIYVCMYVNIYIYITYPYRVGRKFLKKTVCRNVKKCRFYFTSLIIKWNYEVLINWNKDYGALFDYHTFLKKEKGTFEWVKQLWIALGIFNLALTLFKMFTKNDSVNVFQSKYFGTNLKGEKRINSQLIFLILLICCFFLSNPMNEK